MRERGLVLEENFVFALERHIDHYKKGNYIPAYPRR